MRNITKLAIWTTLKEMGFVPINYKFRRVTVAIGASLQREAIDVSGKKFQVDVITIAPTPNRRSDGRNYNITGDVKTPYWDIFYTYENGRKEEVPILIERINQPFKPSEIISIIHKIQS